VDYDDTSHPTITKANLEQLGEKKIREAEVLDCDAQLRHFGRQTPSLIHNGVDPETAYRKIHAKRDQALKEIGASSPSTPDQPINAAGVLYDSLDELDIAPASFAPTTGLTYGYAGSVQMPRVSEGINIVPNPSATSGSLVTNFLRPFGGIQFDGEIRGVDSLPLEDLDPAVTNTWLRNWNYFVAFPPPSITSILTYWFDVFVQVNVFRDSGAARFLSFASLGENSNYSPGNPTVEVNIDAGWPINADLEEPSLSEGNFYNGRYGFLSGRTSIKRTLSIGRGKTPVIAITLGAIGMLGKMGRCTFFFGGSGGPSFILPQNADRAEGRICFHYAPVAIVASGSS
jgi:hypothetical protein